MPPQGWFGHVWRDHRLVLLLLASALLHLFLVMWYPSPPTRWAPMPDLLLTVEPPPPVQVAPVVSIPVPELKPEVSSVATPPAPIAAVPVPETTPHDPSTQSPVEPNRTTLEWQMDTRLAAEAVVRLETNRRHRQTNQWFRAPSIMWGEIPRVFDRQYVLTHFRPTGVLGDPAGYYGKDFKGIGFAIGSCFIGLPKVDIERLYDEYYQRFPSVYPAQEVAPLSLFSCGF